MINKPRIGEYFINQGGYISRMISDEEYVIIEQEIVKPYIIGYIASSNEVYVSKLRDVTADELEKAKRLEGVKENLTGGVYDKTYISSMLYFIGISLDKCYYLTDEINEDSTLFSNVMDKIINDMFKKDLKKAYLWMNLENPLLDGYSPRQLVEENKLNKLYNALRGFK